MPGGSQTTRAVSQQMTDPNVYQALYGQGATQAIYGKGGKVKVPGTVGTGGLLNTAQNLSQEPALNPIQNEALQQSAEYIGSPASMAGYDALRGVSGGLMGQQNPVNLSGLPQVQAAQAQLPGGPAPQMGAAQASLPNYQVGGPIDYLGIAKAVSDTFKPGDISAGSVGGSGVNWRDAADRALSGEVNNPYLTQMAQGAADIATENYLRNVAPALRSGARQTGMYGSSRQGIAEGLSQSDLNNQILRAGTDLFGNAYESAQQRAAALSGQMAGIDANAQIANAQMALQADIARQSAALQAGQLGLSTAQGLAGYDIGRQGLGLNAANLMQSGALANAGLAQQANQSNLGAALDWAGLQQQGALANAGFQNQANLANASNWLSGQGLGLQGQQLANAANIAGAGMAQDATQIPLQNLNSLYGIGSTFQQAPWSQLGNYANLLYPQTQLGAANTSQQQTSQQIGAGQAALGLGMAALGGMGGMGGGGSLMSMSPWSPQSVNSVMQGIGVPNIGNIYPYGG